ncbi:acylase [Pendulispora brunnea]|uniref:Acylase n=1 Tax=Pendulispora brunnea TaxID=2905690 RepID=A0ABZ2KCT1_9BACT
MKKLLLALPLVAGCSGCNNPKPLANEELTSWQQQAQNVTIVRDDWGIAHVYGKSDADAVFGMMYAQAEDDFNRVETNYLNAMGRLAEAEGEAEIYRDLRMKLFIDPEDMKAQYRASPEWLRALMDAYAAGLNFYLRQHPQVKPRVIQRFEPWMALTFSEGSIGGDVERISLPQLEAFYGKPATAPAAVPEKTIEEQRPQEPKGSNGFAISPSNSASKHALLWINPHTTFFFRAELQMVSEQGLNAYGAVTWGQFFVYQGFNERAGWMHTSSGVDCIDEYAETVAQKDGKLHYRYGAEDRPLTVRTITVPYKTPTGTAQKEFTIYRTHHGPIVREMESEQGKKWVSVRLMQEPMKALMQSYSRTKARNLQTFKETLELHTNSSNNTVFADADGNIAYFHANFIPKRDPAFDWRKPVDGSNPATEWQGVHGVDEAPNVLNPPNGWIQNTNNWPYSAAGTNSPKASDYPSYVDRNVENPRGLHAVAVLRDKKDFTLDSLTAVAFDSQLPEFDRLLPDLFKAYDALPASDPRKTKLAEPIAALHTWDRRWSLTSIATSLALFWGEDFWQRVTSDAQKAEVTIYEYMETKASAQQRLDSLGAAVDKLKADFGTWQTPWGDINRLQRRTADIVQSFDDNAPSMPIGFASGRWGSLASFGARAYPGTKKWYGASGNSFVAVVEFGDQVRARAISVGGQKGDPSSPHFNDQSARYATGALRDVYFYRPQLQGHTEREYHPGE